MSRRETAEQLIRFINASPTAFHAVRELGKMLEDAGFRALSERERWELERGKAYYVTRNGSSLIAFRIPAAPDSPVPGFQIIASHSDSPSFKIKEQPELKTENSYIRLNVEKYGGMLMAPWFDRPLSAAGRVIAERQGRLYGKLVNLDRDLLLIPNVAIHMNRKVNEGYAYNPQKDLLPLYGMCGEGKGFLSEVAEAAGLSADDIRGMDLFLYNRQPGTVWGTEDCFLSAPRLDDLECAWASVRGLIDACRKTQDSATPSEDTGAAPAPVLQPEKCAHEGCSIPVCCVFDNEEVGSGTKQGAASTFLKDTLQRILFGLQEPGTGAGSSDPGMHGADLLPRALAGSFMISADNAHALHPNHPELSDPVNRPVLNGGIVIKHSANQKYTTDGISAALFRTLLKGAGLKYQEFLNRSDMLGGSTLGNISNTQVSLNTVDIGLPQLAMHSPFETAGTEDLADLVKAAALFYSAAFHAAEDGSFGWR